MSSFPARSTTAIAIVSCREATPQGLDRSDLYRKDLPLTTVDLPQLSPVPGKPSRLEVSVCNATTPAICVFNRKTQRAFILLTEQGALRGKNGSVLDNGLTIEESPDRAASVVHRQYPVRAVAQARVHRFQRKPRPRHRLEDGRRNQAPPAALQLPDAGHTRAAGQVRQRPQSRHRSQSSAQSSFHSAKSSGE